MIVGEHSRDNDLDVNVVREKKMTNMRASSADEAIRLVPVRALNLEQAIEFIAEDEMVEVTPSRCACAKRFCSRNRRPKRWKRASRRVETDQVSGEITRAAALLLALAPALDLPWPPVADKWPIFRPGARGVLLIQMQTHAGNRERRAKFGSPASLSHTSPSRFTIAAGCDQRSIARGRLHTARTCLFKTGW